MIDDKYEKFYLNEMEKKLLEPVVYYYNIKGNDIRTCFCHHLGNLCGIDQKEINDVSELITLLHNATLVIDDIQDNSKLRRNKMCAHLKYGTPLTINSGYLAIFRLLMEIDKRTDIRDELKNKIRENLYYGHIGQGMDIYFTSNQIIPTMEDYELMMYYKTGLLFSIILDLLKEKTNNKIIIDRFPILKMSMIKFSHFYQIRDDYINLTDFEYWEKRGFCQDFDEKKISYFIVYAKHYNVENYQKIVDLIKNHKSSNDKLEILKIMNDNHLFSNIYDLLIKLRNEILEVLSIENVFEKLPVNKFNYNQAYNYVNNKI